MKDKWKGIVGKFKNERDKKADSDKEMKVVNSEKEKKQKAKIEKITKQKASKEKVLKSRGLTGKNELTNQNINPDKNNKQKISSKDKKENVTKEKVSIKERAKGLVNKVKENRMKTIVGTITIVLFAVVAIIAGQVVKEQNRINAMSAENRRAMNYEQVQEGDEVVENTNGAVNFDAFFLRDLNGDGYTESIRGTSKEIGKEDTLYMELNVQTEGYLKNAKIEINGENFYLQTALPKDDELKDNYIGNNIKTIEFNDLANGTQKLLTGVVRSGDYSYNSRKAEAIGNNINNYSKVNSVTLTGTYVNGAGEEKEISKTVEFNIDWYGTTKANIYTTNQTKNIENAIDEENGVVNLDFTVYTEETNNALILSKNQVEGEIPELNGYAPTSVEYTGSNGVFNYDAETRTFTITRESVVAEDGTVTSEISSSCSYGIKVTYPIDAYYELGTETVTLKVPVKTYYEGYNNPNEEFTNPYKSNIASATIVANYQKPSGTVARFEVTVGKYISNPSYRYIVSKQKPLNIYNGISENETEDEYLVKWYATTGSSGTGNIIMKETKDGETQKTDEFIKTDSSTESMEEVTSFTGIYFSNPENILGEEGEIKVYDEDTGNLLVTFNKDNWNKYSSSNPYKYEIPVKHIRVETSEVKSNQNMYVYNIKTLDDEQITTKYTREQFDNLQYIKSTLAGYIGGAYINTDTHQANYEAPVSIANISISNNTLSTQSTEKNAKITIQTQANASYNQVKWQNGTFLVKIPDEILTTEINEVTISNNVQLTSYELIENENGTFIKINTQNDTPQTYTITIDVDLSPDPRIATTTKQLELYATNEVGSDYYYKTADIYDVNNNLNTEEMVNKTSTSISLVSPNSLLTNQTATNYDEKGSTVVSPEIADIKPVYAVVDQEVEEQTVDIGVQIKNNYASTISEIQILGKIPFEGNTYVLSGGDLGSTFTTKMENTGIQIPAELAQIAKVYYSENETPDKELSKEENGWKIADQVENWDNIKTFLIDLGDYVMPTGKEFVFNYTVKIPNGLEFNQVSYSHHGVYFCLDTDQGKYRTQTEPNRIGFRIAEKYNLELTKYQTGKDKLVPGATYSITEITTNEGGEETRGESKTAVTNAQGILTINNLYAEKEYEIQEIKTPDDYELNSEIIRFIGHVDEEGTLTIEKKQGTTKGEIQVEKQEGQDYKVKIQVEDEAKATLKVTKKEQGTENLIQGARFKLTGYNLNENGRNLTTNANGEITFSGLSVNQEYTLQEVKAEGYYLANPIKFKIVNNDGNYTVEKIEDENATGEIKEQTITEEDSIPTISITIEDEKIPTYDLQLIKIKKTTESTVSDDELIAKAETALADTQVEYLEGAKFKLYKGTEEIGEYTTDSTGTVTIPGLYQYVSEKDVDQTYTLKEVLAPAGYAKVKDITFKVQEVDGILVLKEINEYGEENDSTRYTAEGNTIKLTIEDSPSFKLIKKDAETQTTIPNIKFAIYNVDNGEVPATDSKGEIIGTKETINGKEYYTVTTNENGEITADLPEGLYKAVEVQAPEQYDISNSIYYFGIGASREAPTTMGEAQATGIGGSSSDEITSIAPTSDGGYIAVGYFESDEIQVGDYTLTNSGKEDGMLIKYSREGEVEWTRSVGGSDYDQIVSVAPTNDEGIIVGGYFESDEIQVGDYTLTNSGKEDGMLIKYSREGDVEWARSVGGSNSEDIQSVVATSDGGYIAGGNFRSSSIQVGDYILTNNSSSIGYSDGMIIKYSREGAVEWVKSVGGNGVDYIYSISSTDDGGYIAGGNFRSSSIQVGDYILTNNSSSIDYPDGMIIKYSREGDVEWAKSVGGSDEDSIQSVARTSDGGIIAGGYFEGSSIQVGDYTLTNNSSFTSYSEGMIIKYSAEGEVEWVRSVGGKDHEYINSVAETSDGGLIAGGYFEDNIQVGDYALTNNGSNDGMIIKYSAEGEVEWARSVGGEDYDEIISVAETNDGGLIAGGHFGSDKIQVGEYTLMNSGSYDGMIIKFEEKELVNVDVTKAEGIGGDDGDYINSVAETSDGGYIVGGAFKSDEIQMGEHILTNSSNESYYGYDGMIIKYNTEGVIEWARSVGGSEGDYIESVAVTSDGGVIAGGYFESSSIRVGEYTLTNSGGYDGMIIKYSAEGEVEWAKRVGGSSEEQITALTLTSDEGVIAGGYFKGASIQVGEYTLTNNYNSDEYDYYSDGMMIKYSAKGEVEWARNVGGNNNDQITTVISTIDEGYIVGGYFESDEIQVGKYILTNSGKEDGMLIKYSSNGIVEWARSVGGSDDDYIESVELTSDGGTIVGGYFHSNKIQIGDYIFTKSGYKTISGGMIIKYDKEGAVKWAETIKGNSSVEIQGVMGTNDGGYIAGGYFKGASIQVGEYTLTNSGKEEGMLIKYSREGEVEWARRVGESGNEQITAVTSTSDGGVIAGGYFDSSTIEEGRFNLKNKGYDDGLLLKFQPNTGVSEIQELTVENTRKEFKITTDVQQKDGIKGGTISGEDENSYEIVKYGETSTKEIKMTPEENYEIIGITVNGKEYPFEEDADGTYTMPPFENMLEDKHIVVTFALKDNKLTINKVDSTTKEPLQGATFEIKQMEVGEEGYITEITTNSEGQGIVQIPFGKYQITEIKAPEGYELNEAPIEIEFRADGDKHEITIENSEKAKVIVHHYLKDNNGEYTTTKVAEDEILEGKGGEEYKTNPKLDLEKYELEKDENGQYVIPENATGKYTSETTEVTYYYEEKEIPLTVYYYIEGTTEQVPLKDGTVAEDIEVKGKENETYNTEEISSEKLDERYELIAIPENASGVYTGEEVIVIYYYRLKEKPLTIIKANEAGEVLANAVFDIVDKVTNQTRQVITNEEGKAKIDLQCKEYIIKEIKAPEGYKLNKKDINITIDVNKDNILTIQNENINYYNFEINKIDAESKEPLSGVEFELKYITQYGEEKAEKYVTDSNGKILLENLEDEIVYTLKETNVPKGYLQNTEEIQFVIHYVDGKYEVEILKENLTDIAIEGNTIKANIENKPSLKIVKQDNHGNPIQGVKFTITNEQGQEVTDGFGNPVGEVEEINGEQLKVLTTNENGVIAENLLPGKYILTEVQTPSKYILPEENERTQTIEITQLGYERTYVEQTELLPINFENISNVIDSNVLESELRNTDITADGKIILATGLLGNTIITGENTVTGEEINLNVTGEENAINIIFTPEGKVEKIIKIESEENSASVSTNILSMLNGDNVTLGMYMGTIRIPAENTISGQEFILTSNRGISQFIVVYNEEGKVKILKDISYLGIELNNFSDITLKCINNQITIIYPYSEDTLTIPAEEAEQQQEINVNNEMGYMIANLNEDLKITSIYAMKNTYAKFEQETMEPLSTGENIIGGYNDSGSIIFTEDETVAGETIELDNSGDGIIAKYNQEGKVEWAKKLGSQAEYGGYNKITEVSDGYIAIAYYQGNIVIPKEETEYGEEIKVEGSEEQDKLVLIKYTEEGKVEWITNIDENMDIDNNTLIKETEEGYSIIDTNNMLVAKYQKIYEQPIAKEQAIVTIQNKLGQGNVIVHHYKENTTESLSADQTITGEIDSAYETQPATDIPVNYELVSMPDNATGTIKEGTTEVIYYYKLKEPNITEQTIEKESSTEKITLPDQAIDYNINYTAKVDNYIGNATVTIVDTLPYEIDLEKSNIANGSYDSEEKTITWTEEIGDIDTFVNGEKEINITKEISLVYKDIDVTQAKVENTVTGTINLETPQKEEKVEDTKEIPTEYTTQITVNKIWNDNETQAGRRPESIIIVVKNGDQEVKTQEITKANMVEGTTNQWSTVIEGLQKYDENGNEIQYTVEEREKTEGDLKFYEVEENNVAVQDKQATIRNNFKTPDDVINVTVRKIWNDNNDANGKRPESIKIQLLANGEFSKEQTIDEEISENDAPNIWEYTFVDLAKYDENGQEIQYTVQEQEVNKDDLKFYETTEPTGDMVNGYEITNTFTVPNETIELKVNKEWRDNETQAKRRPGTIVINVKAENADNNDPEAVIDTYELNTKTETSHTFKGLPKYNSKGEEIEYKVEEKEKNADDLKFYETTIGEIANVEENKKEVTIINTFERPKDLTEITVTKVWNDKNNEAGKRPESIKLQLKNGNNMIKEQEVNVSNVDVVTGEQEEAIIEQINNNVTGSGTELLRAEEVEVWQYTFTEVDKYDDNGQEIVYTADETEVNSNDLEFYNKEIKGLTVINTFTQDTTKVNVPVTKIWEDNEIQAQRRPESVIIVLKANGAEVDRYELSTKDEIIETEPVNNSTENSNINKNNMQESIGVNNETKANGNTSNTWGYVFKDLPKYDEYNNIINYTVEEKEKTPRDLKFYTSKVEGTTITNTFTRPTDTISIEVSKKWEDQEDKYKKRPVSIRLQVKTIGENGTEPNSNENNTNEIVVKSAVVTKEQNWTYTFTKLDKYDENGQEITYTVDEQEVMENDLYYYGKEVGEVIDKAGETNVKEAEITNTMNKTPSTVVVKYVDKNTGKEITDEKTKEGIIGDPYDVTEDVKEIPGYTLVEEPAEKTGIYTSEPQEKIYYYAKNTKVTVKYLEQDETPNDIADNKVLAQEKTMLGYEGENYSTFAEDIEGYTLVETTNNTSGVMQREEIVVIYYYAPNTNVVVKYLEKDNTPEDNTDNKVLEPERTIEGYVGKEYKTIKEDIPGYTFIESTENTEGAMTKDPIEVIYYYAQNTKVIVKYLEKDDTPEDNTDNQVLAKEEVIEGYEGKEYETEQKTIDNYTFVESTNNTKGNMTKETIEVIYYYAQNTKAKVQHIDRETGKILKEETKNGKVGDIFETQAEDFEGYVLVGSPEEPNIVMDKTGEQVVKYYYAHVSAGVIEKHIDDITGELLYSEEHKGNEGDYYNIPSKTFEGYDLVTEDSEGNSKLPTNAEGNMTQNLIEVKYYYIKKAKVIVKYLEQDNTPEDLTDNLVLEDEETIEGHENDDYTTTAKDIKGYNLVETPENATGKMEITKNPDGTYNTEIIVVYYYKKQAGGVIENHIDIHTNKKLAVEEHEGNVGDEYNIPARGFEGYDLVAVDEEGNNMLPTNAKGQMTEEVIEVNYYYEKQAKVKVEYIDKETGNKLDEEEIQGHVGDSYETEEKQFEGYDLVEKPSNSKGEMEEEEIIVKYYYERKAEVEVKYLEKGTDYEVSPTETIEGHVGDKYETEQKEIPYYKFVEKTENYKGEMEKDKITVIYYYEKQLFNLSVDKWVENVNVNGISQGTQSITTKDQLYKVDIHRSKTETADIKITYKIRITNKGEIEGTAGEIVEVIPAGYSFNQEDNSIYWENKNGTLTTDALKDEMIQPGQYKEIEIVLRWEKGENNFGQKDNLVILSNLDNPAGYEDVNKEDNSSSSSMLLTIATGLDRNDRIVIIGIVQIVLAISIGLLLSYKKKEKNSK